jgi:uncharacterized protein YndB with AHSA1/START domain
MLASNGNISSVLVLPNELHDMPNLLGVYKTRRLPYPAALVYEAWIDPTVRVAPISYMEAEVRVGGRVRIVIESGSTESTMLGRYLEVEAGEWLKYTWCWQHRGEETLVTVKFQPAGSGCRLTLMHEGFSRAGDREAHDVAWEAYLPHI